MSAASQAAEQQAWLAAARTATRRHQPPTPTPRCTILTTGRENCGCITCTRELATQTKENQ
jgi:hypothetical protein